MHLTGLLPTTLHSSVGRASHWYRGGHGFDFSRSLRIFSGLYSYLLKLLHNCKDLFHFYSLSTVHPYDLYHIHFMSFSSYNGYKLNSHLTCFRQGFIAQFGRPGITEVMGSNAIRASEFFLGFICNCLSYFATAKIYFTCI